MTIQEALTFGRQKLSATIDPTLDARLLLQFVLEVNHAYLIAHGDLSLELKDEKRYRQLLERASRSEPLPYLTGLAPFYGLDFEVGPEVLIPRPETEQLVDAALAWVGERDGLFIVDVGTGSGCIPITLALRLPTTRIDAIDISPAALALAQKNSIRHEVSDRIRFHSGDLLKPINGNPDLVLANLPYVSDQEWTSLSDGVKWYEPDVALRGGYDGLDLIRQLLRQSRVKLAPGGAVFLEVGWQQGPKVQQLALSHFPLAQVSVSKDYAGRERIVSILT